MKIDQYLNSSPIFLLHGMRGQIERAMLPIFQGEGVNFSEALILITLLFDSKGGINPSQLVNSLNMSKAAVSQSLSKLESLGLIKRSLDNRDARKYGLELTTKGKKKANVLVKFFESVENKIEERLSFLELSEFTSQIQGIERVLTVD